nr:glycosyltransferase [Rhabdothermincola salaria]
MALDVVVVSHRSADHLAACLAGLPPEAHVVVVDNASPDASVAVAEAAGAEVVAGAVNAGFAAGANRGAALGTGEAVLFLNPDAVVDADMVRALVQRLVDEPDLAVVSPRLRHPDGSQQRVWWPFPSPASAWSEAIGRHRWPAGRRGPSGPRGGADDGVGGAAGRGFVIGACFLVRRSVFDALGGFDTRFWLYGEEAELCRRAVDAGWRVAVADDLEAAHVGGASAAPLDPEVFDHFERGGEHFVAVHAGKAALVSYRLGQLLGAGVRAVVPGSPVRRTLHRLRSRRLVAQLVRRPTSVALDSPATRAPGRGLVVCSLEPWDEVWRRNQFLVDTLLRRDPDLRVLFVEPPFDWVHERRRGAGRRRRRGLRPVPGEGRVVRVEPGKGWPRHLGPLRLGTLADRSLRRQVREAADELGLVAPRLWVNDAHYAHLATRTGWPALYDVTDDWSEAGRGDPAAARAAARVRADEAKLLAECEAVVVCSEALAGPRRAVRPDVEVIPNGADVSRLTTPQPRPEAMPPAPTAVYVGTLHEDRLDVDLVEGLAAARPDMAVVLVGPDALAPAAQARLATHPNVHLVGARPQGEVAGWLQHADVVVVPHVVSAFTESLDPIKAYEVLAVGRPTVATPVAGFRDLGDPVRTVSAERFVATVAELVDARPVASRPRPVPTWDERGEAFAAVLDRLGRAGGPGRHRDRPLRVALVTHCAQLGGAELALERMVPAVRARGVEVVVVLGEHGPLAHRLRTAGATVLVRPLDPRLGATRRDEVVGWSALSRAAQAAREVVRLRRLLVEVGADVVHTNSLKAHLYGGLAGRLAGAPVVWHVRDRIAADYLPRPAVVALRALARRLPSAVVANSEATRATLGAEAARATVVHDALPAELVGAPPGPAASPGGEGPGRWGAKTSTEAPGPLEVVMVGRLAPWKGQHVVVDAVARAFSPGMVRLHLVGAALFGEDDYEAQLRAQVRRLGIDDDVVFTGFVDDVPARLAAADVVVHASVLPEPFGQVVIEAMAAGRAVVAADAGGPAEVVTDGVDGLLVAPDDVDALAAALARLAADADLRARLGREAARTAAVFTPAAVAERLLGVYESLPTRR